ncbi:F-box only protein 48 [Rhinoraja longicauda]
MAGGYQEDRHDPIDNGNINVPAKPNELDNSPSLVLLLPPKLILKIFSKLDIQSLTYAAMTCRKWNNLIENDDLLWHDHCLKTLGICEKELDEDRASGLSCKTILVKNYKKSKYKQRWLRGDFSRIQSADELQNISMCELNVHDWGEIFDAEMKR